MSDDPPKEPEPLADASAPSSRVLAPLAPENPARGGLLGAVEQALSVLRFYSRLPVPVFAFERTPHAAPDMATAPPAIALTGALLGTLAAAVLYTAASLGLPPALAAILAITALAMMTGAMHEDGLADTADGLWGGATRERRLEIMRDSRIGTYGVVALILSLALRCLLLATLVDRSGAATAALLLIAAAAISRVAGLLPLALLPPARSDGAAASVVAPKLGLLLVTLAVLATASIAVVLPAAALAAALAAVAVTYGLTRIAAAKIAGHTGDIAGAAQQLSEIAFLLAVVAATA